MENSYTAIVKATKNLLYGIHTGQHREVCNLCNNDILWKYNHSCSEGAMNKKTIMRLNKIIKPSEIYKLEYNGYFIHKTLSNHIIITGIYCIHKSVDKSIKKYYFDYTIVFSDGLACYIEIIGNNPLTKIHKVVSVTEAVYNMEEDEILYIEAVCGHIIWHCQGAVIESLGSLKNIGSKMSEDFIRVHRSYMVNKKYTKVQHKYGKRRRYTCSV